MTSFGPLVRVISGGQNGVDLAALIAAKSAGLETGGCMPKGFRTLDGPRPEYAERFGMFEDQSSDAYPPRTHRNVRETDATLRIAVDFESPGEKTTREAIVRYRRPSFDLLVEPSWIEMPPLGLGLYGMRIATWIFEKNVCVLNVAGNSERTAPGIGLFTEGFLRNTFDLIARSAAFRSATSVKTKS